MGRVGGEGEGRQDGMTHGTTCRCGKPLPYKKSATCGAPECQAANVRWIKLMWWHRHRGKHRAGPIVNLTQALPEVDLSRTANDLSIPEVDTSDMPDTRNGKRMQI